MLLQLPRLAILLFPSSLSSLYSYTPPLPTPSSSSIRPPFSRPKPRFGRRLHTARSHEPFTPFLSSSMSNSIIPPPQAANASVASRSIDKSNANDDTETTGDCRGGDARFSKFLIRSSCIFYRSKLSLSFVNLRPIVPGHVLVMPRRCVPLLEDLSDDEYDDLWRTVRHTQRILRAAYPTSSTSFNVAVQDGPAAGQSVPHVHVHILPRSLGDIKRNDDIYEALETWAPREEDKSSPIRLVVGDDDQRRDRTVEEMEDEAALYRRAAAIDNSAARLAS